MTEDTKFYNKLIEGLKNGTYKPSEVLEFEDVLVPSPEEVAKLSSADFMALEEKTKLADKLRETRETMELKETESAVVDSILAKRDSVLTKKLQSLTPSETREFEDRMNEV
ncbi:MAG: hypothetical protein Q8N88_04320 [Nanoarchaeota archaeon]|nr:hypothetical protein [Nanoarchaeota archaeon]